MREYNTPEIKVLNLELTDIICTSTTGGGMTPGSSFDATTGGGMNVD